MPHASASAARPFAIALLSVLIAGVLVNWSTGVWAVSVVQTGILLLAGVWIVAAIVKSSEVRWSPLLFPIAILFLWGLAQLASGRTVYRFETWVAVLYWLTNAAAFFVCLQVLGARESREMWFVTMLVFAAVVALVVIVQLYATPDRVYGIFTTPFNVPAAGPFLYRNQYAAFVELTLPLALYRAIRAPSGVLTFGSVAALLTASVIATASRSGTILLVIEIAAFVTLGAVKGLIRGRAASTLLLALFGLVILFTTITGWQNVWQRFQEQEYGQRPQIVRSTLAMIHDRPWFGFGLGAWRTMYPAYATFDDGLLVNEAHSDWAQWAAEGGIPFALVLFAVLLMAIPLIWRSPWGLGVAVVFAHCVIDYPTREPVIAILLFCFVGALAAASSGPAQKARR